MVTTRQHHTWFNSRILLTVIGACVVLGIVIWQAVAAYGVPDPMAKNLSPAAVVLTTGVLVFREGLEAILVLAAVTAGLVRSERAYGRPVALGAGAALLATVVTWFGVVALIAAVNAPELAIQAATGLVAIVVLLVVMNWFFHKVYWTGWITHHNNRRRQILETAQETNARPFLGLALLGFTAIYREGFEIVLFLQNLRLQAGTHVVLFGAAIGAALTAMVAVLTFIAHQRLPYKQMLVLTGILLGGVLIVMVGESVQEMQQAGWLATTPIGVSLPGWLGVWFAVFPDWQGMAAQLLAAGLVLGSYVAARRVRLGRRRSARPVSARPKRENEAHEPVRKSA